MRHLPIFLELNGKAAVVVGGGVVAARRAELLVRAGARVTAFAAELSDEFLEFREQPNFRHEAREPEPGDFEDCGALLRRDRRRTPDRGRRGAAAKGAGALINVADRPEFCDFIMPSIVDRSPLVIAISTGGASPILGPHAEGPAREPDPGRLWAARPSDERFRDAVAAAIPLPVMRRRFWESVARGADRRSGACRQRKRGQAPNSRRRNRTLGASVALPARRSLSRRRRAGRSGSPDLPRAQAHAEGRCRALRPADRRG